MSTGKEKGMEMNEDTHKYPQLRNAEIIVHYGSKERACLLVRAKGQILRNESECFPAFLPEPWAFCALLAPHRT